MGARSGSWSSRRSMTTRAPGGRDQRSVGQVGQTRHQAPGAAGRSRCAVGPRPRSSSQRSCSTTRSASPMMPRDILLTPTRRSVNTMGTSTTRAPARLGEVGGLDLEHVAAGVDPVPVDDLERLPAPRLEAARQVMGRQPQHQPRERGTATRHDAAADAPVDDAAAGDVAGPDGQVGAIRAGRVQAAGEGVHERRQVVGRVRPVGVHLDDAPARRPSRATPKPSM